MSLADYFYHMMDISDTQEKPAPDKNEKEKPELYGVGGWLLFFWISLVFISPLYSVVSLHGDFISLEMNMPVLEAIPLWEHIKVCYWINLICCILLIWIAGYRLVKRLEWKSVRLTILVLWLTGPVSVIVTALYFYLIFPPSFDMLINDIFIDFIRSFYYPLIWTLYLLRSKRVRNTYPKPDRLAAVI